jgi:CheY-like chemotaxis protein
VGRGAKLVITLLLVDDDPDDRLLIGDALEEGGLTVDLRSVNDGEELMDYLYRRGRYADLVESPHPSLVLLDLWMPRKSGHQALEEIRAVPELRRLPVVVLTTSKAEEDIVRAYDLGANSYMVKPPTFDALVEAMNNLGRYWFETVTLPPGRLEN